MPPRRPAARADPLSYPHPGADPEAVRALLRGDPVAIARRLLGATLTRTLDDSTVARCEIVETEAYRAPADRASHAFGGRRTARNESMYADAATAYVYFTYGMHHCLNVVCGPPDTPWAVLIRAARPTHALDSMRRARALADDYPDRLLLSGPGRLCKALSIDRSLDGIDLLADPRLSLTLDGALPRRAIHSTTRVGIASAGAWAARPWRFFVRESPCVSRRPAGLRVPRSAGTKGSSTTPRRVRGDAHLPAFDPQTP